MVESTLTAIGRTTKKAVIGALKGTGEKAQAIVGATAKAKAEQQLTALRQKRDGVSEKLRELNSSSGNAWEQINDYAHWK